VRVSRRGLARRAQDSADGQARPAPGYDWVTCAGCEGSWQVPHYAVA